MKNLKKHYEHYEDIVTVCTLYDPDTGETARGVSVRAKDDMPIPEIGERNAERKALRAIKGRGNEKITDGRAIRQMLRTVCPFTMHAEKNPVLTFQERRRFYGKGMRRNRHSGNAPIIDGLAKDAEFMIRNGGYFCNSVTNSFRCE